MAGIASGLVMVAVGAILRFAIYAPNSHANWGTVGLILIVVGAVAFFVGAIFEAPRRYRRQTTYVQRGDRGEGTSEEIVRDRATF